MNSEDISAYETNRDTILKYYLQPDRHTLSDHQKWLLERWEYCYGLLRQYTSRTTIVKMVVRKYEGRVSRAQAYRDIEDTEQFFGEFIGNNLSFKLTLHAERMDELARLARHRNDFKTALRAEVAAANVRMKLYEIMSQNDNKPLPVNHFTMNVTINQNGEDKSVMINLDELENLTSETVAKLLTAADSSLDFDDAEFEEILKQSSKDEDNQSELKL